MSVEEDLAKSIRKGKLSPRDKKRIASMPARDAQLAPRMISGIKDEYGLDAVPCATPWYDPYTYDSYTYVAVEDILFRERAGGIVHLEMRDRQGKWHVLYEAYCEPVSPERMLEILRTETPGRLGFVVEEE